MAKPYSQDLRDRVMAAIDGGAKAYGIAPLFRVSVSYIYKALMRRRTTGDTTAHQSGAAPQRRLTGHEEALRRRLADHPDMTLAELQVWLSAERGVKASVGCLWNTLKRLELSLKKSQRGRPSRTGRTSPRPARSGVPARAH
jgi:transposase